MIVKMKKVFVVTRAASREPLLEELRNLGVMHMEPVDPSAAAPEELSGRLARIRQAGQAIASVAPAGRKPEMDADAAADEILTIFHRAHENRTRLAALHREAGQLNLWGELRLEQLDALAEAGLSVKFYSVPQKQLGEVAAECAAALGSLPGKRLLVGVAQRYGEPTLPEDAAEIEPPKRDLPDVRAEAAQVDKAMVDDAKRLACLANLSDLLARRSEKLSAEVEYARALAGAMAGDNLFAVQGWVPTDHADTLSADLSERDVTAAVDSREPAEDEAPPTLIQYPRFTGPIRGLFKMLGTVAGYKEIDVSVPFMIALPIFAAMLIGDGGYGAVILIGLLVFYKKASKALGADFTRLLAIIGGVALAWGLLTANFFGVTLYKPLIPVNMSDASRDLVMRISFFMGAIHLSISQIWRGISYWPSLKSIGPFGWAIFIWGMLGVVNHYVLGDPPPLDPNGPWLYLLICGAALAILFESPSKNPIKMLGLGLANFPLSMLSSFSDVISYVRLMAVGLASGVLASSFNELALSIGSWFFAVPILILAHSLNIGLALIAIFAHGVRLNMLEFSNNLGMRWTGQAYAPFASRKVKEIAV